MLVLHIGLPKTGTTTLQGAVFARAEGVAYVHRKRGVAGAALTEALSAYVRAGPLGAWAARRRLVSCIERLDAAAGTILVSHEGTAIRQAEFWTGHGPGRARVVRRLGELGQGLPERLRPLRVLLGVRRQDRWLASSYAHKAGHWAGLDQADFERRLRAIAAAPALDGPLAWLDFAAARRELAGALGAENVLVLPLERLVGAPAESLAAVAGFAGLARVPGPEALRRIPNPRGTGAGEWRMPYARPPLRLDPALGAAVVARFAEANAALAREAGLTIGG